MLYAYIIAFKQSTRRTLKYGNSARAVGRNQLLRVANIEY